MWYAFPVLVALIGADTLAQESPPEAPSSAPATVLEHVVDVAIDGSKRRTDTVTWKIRIDDPEACSAGLITPYGLDGASDSGAIVLENLLLVPGDAAPGTVYSLEQRTVGDRGSHSGVFLTAPDLPVQQTEVTVRAPSWVPLHVWSDPSGLPKHGTRGGRSVTVTWSGLEAQEMGQLVWSTWDDWLVAGSAVVKHVDDRIASKDTLGRRLAADSSSLGVGESIDRVYADIRAEEGNYGSWLTARSAAETIEAGTGSAADRGMVLLSVMRLSGLDAVPASVRVAASRGAFPVMVPAPEMLARPVIAVHRDDGITWIDPSNDFAAPGDLPAALIGGSAWIPGDLPVDIRTNSVVNGNVIVNTNMTIRGDGTASWTANIGASGTAAEAIRSLLSTLDDDGRTEALRKLVVQGRPDLSRFTTTTSGIQRTDRGVKVSLSGMDENAMRPFGHGLVGSIPPVIAPSLAGWLPPNIRVREVVSIAPPPALQILATSTEPSTFRDVALVSRSYKREAQRTNMIVEVERPYRSTTAIREAEATSFLATQAPLGAEILLFGPANGGVAASVRSSEEATPAQLAIIESMLWWKVNNARKPAKILKKALASSGLDDLIGALGHWIETGDTQPWESLAFVAEDAGDSPAIMQIAEGMEGFGLDRGAWLLAASLRRDLDPDVRLRALLMMEQLQPEVTPAAQEDSAGAQAWQNPETIMKAAQAAADELGSPEDPRLVLRFAQTALDEGRATDAEVMLEKVLASGPNPVVEILLAQAAATSGVAGSTVLERVDAAIAAAPFDPAVVSAAAGAADTLGRIGLAREYALTAARLAFDDAELWSALVAYAVAEGDLPAARHAAQRASDLAPENEDMGYELALISTLVHDKDGATLGRSRTADFELPQDWPPDLNTLTQLAPEAALLGLLQYHDAAVVEDAVLLSIRAQMRVERNTLDDAARDGILLATRHSKPEGQALAFAATAGRLYSSNNVKALDSAASKDPTARLTRMEYRLVSAVGDATSDARLLRDDPRAQVIVDLRANPRAAAAKLPGWPDGLQDGRAPTPPGYRSNRTLGAAHGVLAWSDPNSATAILRTSQITGLLPPPIGQLYTASDQPLLTLDNGGQVLRLDGGVIPLYAAVVIQDGGEVIGLGFTIESASRALATALQ